jgi:hypothetical protein
MTALRELRINSSSVDDSVLRAPHLGRLSLGAKRSRYTGHYEYYDYCMEYWPRVPAISGLTRLDLLHVPATDQTVGGLEDLVQLPRLAALSIVFGCVDHAVHHLPWTVGCHS